MTVGHPSYYAVADAILKDPGVQAAVAKIFALGIAIDEDFFVASPEQVMPSFPRSRPKLERDKGYNSRREYCLRAVCLACVAASARAWRRSMLSARGRLHSMPLTL